MHELSIAEALVRQVHEIATREGAIRVTRVTVRVGPLSGVLPQALAFAFPMAAEGSLAEHAELLVEAPRLLLTCRACGASGPADDPFPVCAACGSVDVQLGTDADAPDAEGAVGDARELRLRTIDIE